MHRIIVMLSRGVYPYATGGAEIHAYYVAKELAKHNRVCLVSEGKAPLQIQDRLLYLIIKAGRTPFLSSIIYILHSIAYLLLKLRPIHILHAQVALSPAIAGFLASKMLKVPLIITCHGSEVRLQRSTFIKFLQKLIFSHAEWIIAVSREIRDILVTGYGVEESKITVVPNGYDEELLRRLPKDCRHTDDDRQIVYVGRLSWPKDPFTLMRAFEQVHKVLPDVSLCFVGDGELRWSLEQFCREYGLEKAVRFLGELSHEKTLETMSRSAIFVLSSHSEGLPTALIEALALGKPVVATRVGGIPEVVKDGINGLLVTPASPRDMAEALLELLTNSQKREELGRAARESVKCYTWSKIAEKYETIYEKILSLKKTRI